MKDFDCPYCGEGYDYCDDPISDGDTVEFECSECEKTFVISASVSISYTAHKADCLNDGNHVWEDSSRCPFIIKKQIKQFCTKSCGNERNRDATPEEIEAELARFEKNSILREITLGG